jgi:hypothetical protein
MLVSRILQCILPKIICIPSKYDVRQSLKFENISERYVTEYSLGKGKAIPVTGHEGP